MDPRDYEKRNKLKPGRIKNPSRYVTGRLHSHRRSVEVPADMEPNDNPATRGLTTLDEQSK